ncbi:DUF3025 domain-containing protein [Laribacter hongkongensis]|uniref:DUF3025 domain-containing protein n=1 Tax=Laribacter hongkongensis TaxID=168471 RepID=UPI001EFD58BC|nr:DUF3025 domain-containing protein [Laribacter hongkongensis]MCG9106676.1 DUF3025 domain-containing protein [Laribacter hongkongensis]
MHTISCWRPHWARDPWLAAWRDQVPGPERADWPQQAGFDELLAEARLRGRAVPAALRFSVGLEPPDYYECHIAATGEVPTRPHNWHDWFNALAWLVWPRLKGALNRRHLWAMQAQGEVRRGPWRDAATLLDESGLIVAASDPLWLDALDHMRWTGLLCGEARRHWGRSIEVLPVGHALLEQLLTPFARITGKAWLVQVPARYFDWPLPERRDWLDRQLAARLDDGQVLARPACLAPLPVLGVPGWWPANESEAFYADPGVFCPRRRHLGCAERLDLTGAD